MDAIERPLYLTQEAAELHQTTAWGAHNEEENDLDAAEAYRPLRKRPRHPADVLAHSGEPDSQPDLPEPRPELPLRALKKLRTLVPFLCGEAQDLAAAAVSDLLEWSTQFWGNVVELVDDENPAFLQGTNALQAELPVPPALPQQQERQERHQEVPQGQPAPVRAGQAGETTAGTTTEAGAQEEPAEQEEVPAAPEEAEERFRDNMFAIADAALGPKDQFANHLTTDEVCIRVDGERHNKEDRIDMMNERLKANNLTPAHQSHKQYPELKSQSDKLKTHPEQQTHPGADRDSHHAPASPEEYIIWRLTPLRDFYGRRIPQVRRTRLLMQIFFMAATSATAVLAAADQTAWTPIVVAISAALASWQEFRGVDMKLERYGAVVATLRNLMLWWQTLPEADKANVRHIERLVGRCEMAASSELAAWLSDAQQARDLMDKATSSKDRQKASAAKEAQAQK
ncbi:unnamed protein product [Symbiodinium sp. CCMP2456]|nr:unnamed protein product [Symbiodinium sp. CCMP2456]